jgi:hypothetical protein
MALLNSAFANQLGRSDLFSGGNAFVGAPPVATVVGGSTQAYNNDNSPVTGGGRMAVIGLLALIGAYAAFAWWVRPLLS